MEINRTQNTKRNILWGFVNKIVTLLLPFITRTVMIRTLGAEYLGLNSLYSSILQVLNLTELGFSSAIVYCMYKPIAENDKDSICALLNAYRKIYRILGFAILGIGCALLPILPHLIHGDIPEDVNIYWVYLIYLFNTSISYILYAYKQALPNAFQRTDIISNIASISMGGMYVLQIVVLICLDSYYPYLILLPISTIINNIITSIYVDREYPEYKCTGSITAEQKSEIKEKVIGLFINKVSGTTRNSLDSICLSAFLGLKITAMYNNYFYVVSAVQGIFFIIITSMTAGIGNSMVLDSVEKNYGDEKKINFIYMLLSGWATICMLVLYQPFISVCFGKQYLFQFSIVVEFCVYFYVLRMGDIRTLYADAAGLWWENRYRAIGESIANIVLNIVLGQLFGVHGIIIATLISMFIFNFILGSQIVFKYYFKNNKLKDYFVAHGIYFCVTAIIAVVTLKISNLVNITGIIGLCLKMLLCCAIPAVLYFLIYHKTKIYKVAMPWLLVKCKLDGKLKFLLK